MTEMRLRSRAAPDAVAAQVGKVLGDIDHDVLLTGPARVLMPDGRPLCVYLPGHLSPVLERRPEVYEVLHSLRNLKTDNRGLASGTRRRPIVGQQRTRAKRIASAVIGSLETAQRQTYCRLTAWTGDHLSEYEQLRHLLLPMSSALSEHVPDRFAAQALEVAKTHRDYVVPGTVFSTVTVNNTYPTGVHQDAGDLAAGFSALAVLRRGDYAGGRLVFPEWRVAADLRDGDLILMDAHQWHGNTAMSCPHGLKDDRMRQCCGAERISVVAYFRERMTGCRSLAEETRRAEAIAEKRNQFANNLTEADLHGAKGPSPQADRA
ncbi:hypothetical protein AGRA3207_000183 [Actinomadura graeca]|uniref:2OGFeDO JBP1/TET oxygenase domain-containing protein n=1 Tax=Actinomadura graeca TaxID=2750812 RepID=A0ABX8QM46_9ACTN|nr:hypothetical protein [Actinomadura graeca]QXJ19621.1 hypothetical protein AGRA3207_000183 [Actinomadura graeca]